jgi:hypothetical protein
VRRSLDTLAGRQRGRLHSKIACRRRDLAPSPPGRSRW